MILEIELKNFRKFSDLSLNLNNNLVFIIGDNACGKTTILEAIYFLTRLKSERTNNYRDLIKHNEPFAKAKVITDNIRLETVITENTKLYKKNNIEYKKASEFFGSIPVILFSPDDINLVKASPSGRRKFLDMELSLLNKKYLNLLGETNYYLKQRNLVLQSDKFDNVLFDIFTNKLVENELLLIKSRLKFIDLLNKRINEVHSSVSENENIKLVYKSSLNLDNVSDTLKNIKDNELKYKTTLVGYHRDDFKILLNGLDASHFASEGQMRHIVISFKIALVLVYEEYTKQTPVLLLDDVFSYLDKKRQNNIIEFLKNRPQSIITSTSIDNYESIKDDALIIKL